ncbi:hypothetical protein [Pseudomonas sp. 65/3-MNA-CIBAN-0223]|uniref:hypothetical protein n=1 Tax=Pseudomonas sp. 65/3-MNA-CIBAN-0223 TaxID=3140476 RepID=UPI003328FBE2
MKLRLRLFLTLLVVLSVQGCSKPETVFDKQVGVCVNDVKLGLGDPNSLDMVSSQGIDLANGWYRVKLDYTAKNAFGGRVRGETMCGFRGKDSIELNSEDVVNLERKMAQVFK